MHIYEDSDLLNKVIKMLVDDVVVIIYRNGNIKINSLDLYMERAKG